MSFEIPKSLIDGRETEFAAEVATHIAQLHDFAKTRGQPRPFAHPLVEAAVRRDQEKGKPDTYTADYTIVDDSPEVFMNLNDKKNLLVSKVQQAEAVAKDKLIPPRKMRLLTLTVANINTKSVTEQTDKERNMISLYNKLNAAWSAVGLKAARAESDIEDLNEQTIDSYKVPDFNAG